MECPCKDCQKRTVGCVCEAYKQWKKERTETTRRIATQNMYNGWQISDKKRRR